MDAREAPAPAMVSDLDRIVVAVRYRAPVVETLCKVFDAEVVGADRLPVWAAERTTLRVGVSEIELVEPTGVGYVADSLGRLGPGFFAIGFGSESLAGLRAHLERRGAFFTEHEGRLYLTSDEGVDLPGVSLVFTPAKARERAGLLQRLCGVTLLHRDLGLHREVIRLLGVRPARAPEVREASAGSTEVVVDLGAGSRSHVAIVAPWDNSTPIGRFFFRHGPGVYLAQATSEKLPVVRERLAALGYPSPAGSAEDSVVIPAGLMGGARLVVFADAADCSRWDVSSPLFDASAAWT
jgi:hypothetical protein